MGSFLNCFCQSCNRLLLLIPKKQLMVCYLFEYANEYIIASSVAYAIASVSFNVNNAFVYAIAYSVS